MTCFFVDIYHNTPDEAGTSYKGGTGENSDIPQELVGHPKRIRWTKGNVLLSIPQHPEKVLEWRYGTDWRTPRFMYAQGAFFTQAPCQARDGIRADPHRSSLSGSESSSVPDQGRGDTSTEGRVSRVRKPPDRFSHQSIGTISKPKGLPIDQFRTGTQPDVHQLPLSQAAEQPQQVLRRLSDEPLATRPSQVEAQPAQLTTLSEDGQQDSDHPLAHRHIVVANGRSTPRPLAVEFQTSQLSTLTETDEALHCRKRQAQRQHVPPSQHGGRGDIQLHAEELQRPCSRARP